MFTDAVAPGSLNALERIGRLSGTGSFCLAGGTAVALHLGHRLSYDLDFFSAAEFDVVSLRDTLAGSGCFQFGAAGPQRLHGTLNGVKVSFMHYRPPLLAKPLDLAGLSVADLADLAPIKLDTVGSRGLKKDFCDLYFIAREAIPLDRIFVLYRQKYAYLNVSFRHLLLSLTYFEDAERTGEEVLLLRDAPWEAVKEFFIAGAGELLRRFKEVHDSYGVPDKS
ncbi:MAG TPA: nucleotidyl transferase AbiEii/AbiGii toxin family protein [Spirochaetia bacterium]|nr:nucleotidyl transferase AbiEii/AbiGii toxin family protein [Spirochaetia bacterium]